MIPHTEHIIVQKQAAQKLIEAAKAGLPSK